MSDERAIKKVLVVGGGKMGTALAVLIAQKGIGVVIKKTTKERAEKAEKDIDDELSRATQRGRILPDAAGAAKKLITITSDYKNISDVDLVIETTFEDMQTKRRIFGELDKILPPDVIFATNTSALSITEIASATNRRDKIIGAHFFNPPTKMLLVELVPGKETSAQTLATIKRFAEHSLGKISIIVKECPGFLVNRLLMAYLNEAVLLLSETKLTVKDMDETAKKFGWPIGPFALLDYLGIDIAAKIAETIYAGYGERAKPAPLLEIFVKAGRLGRKTGCGFATNTKGPDGAEQIIDREFPKRAVLSPRDGFRRMMLCMANEAWRCVEEKISSPDDVETGCKYGIGFPDTFKGPLHWSEKEGLKNIRAELFALEKKFGIRFTPAKLLAEYAEQDKRLFEE